MVVLLFGPTFARHRNTVYARWNHDTHMTRLLRELGRLWFGTDFKTLEPLKGPMSTLNRHRGSHDKHFGGWNVIALLTWLVNLEFTHLFFPILANIMPRFMVPHAQT